MAKSSKFAGSGRTGNTLGSVPKSTRAPYTPSGRGPGAPSTSIRSPWKPGQKATGTSSGSSTHNDIGTFLRGAKSRGPYGGPSFASINQYEKNYKQSTPSSSCGTPSGSGRGTGAPRTSKRGVSDYNNPMKETMQSPNNRRPVDR